MKKTFLTIICLTFIILIVGTISINAIQSRMNTDIQNEFQYKTTSENVENSESILQESEEYRLIKRTTLYLLGMQTNTEENVESYLTRKDRFLNLNIFRR